MGVINHAFNTMDIQIKTKLGIGDIFYGYYGCNFHEFRVDNIEIRHDVKYNRTEVSYKCTAIVPEDCDCTFSTTLLEQQAYTKDEIKGMLEKLIKEE